MKYVMLTYGTLMDQRMNGQYLEEFDPDYNDGLGLCRWTMSLDRAMKFDSPIDGFKLWRTQSTVHPIRLTDGRPNRPLTAHTIEMVPVTEGRAGGSPRTN